ncbi:deoxyribose-phosphate aldolase [Aminiphilus sp.]|jgi:deoxyribose-phosphate aldolase|uniref:deoxyribose-phosphate aldolase n=1 Tax=Aminiphilus sp. TaxID=1872488 RepID=UPI001BCE9B47|nr:deoxyribose-phosphate aldolase [Aminiphilus sp.]
MTDIELLEQKARQNAAKAEAGMFPSPEASSVPGSIAYPLLTPGATPEDISRHCDEAIQNGFASITVPLNSISLAVELLSNSPITVGTMVGFPFGSVPLHIKEREIFSAIASGVQEINVVVDIAPLRQGKKQLLFEEMKTLREITEKQQLTFVLEVPFLNALETITAVRLASMVHADFVSTSSGFFGTASITHASILASASPEGLRVKTVGEIRTLRHAQALLSLGIARIETPKAPDLFHTIAAR